MPRVVDTVLVYQFAKRLILPFEEWDAFKLGIIDKDGKVLKKQKNLTTTEEKRAWGYYDILTCNLKKLLAKVPGGKSKLGGIAAIALLLKEQQIDPNDVDLIEEMLDKEMSIVSNTLSEEMVSGGIANAVGPGNIAGTDEAGDDPPVRDKAWNKYKRKNSKKMNGKGNKKGSIFARINPR